LAGLTLLSIPAIGEQAVSGLSDIPAAAMVAIVAALTVGASGRGKLRLAAIATSSLLAVLTKPSAIAPLLGLMLALSLSQDRRVTRAISAALAGGFVSGIAVHAALARRAGDGLIDHLTAGTGGYWGALAAAERRDAILRMDVLGSGLCIPLAFALVYVLARLVGVRHRRAAPFGLVIALAWILIGLLIVRGPESVHWSPEAIFLNVAIGGLLVVFALGSSEDAPSRDALLAIGLLGIPPLAVWAYATPYADRLAATAWPGLVSIIALCLVGPIRTLTRSFGVAAVAPALALILGVWGTLASFDGFGHDEWRELRSLGLRGVTDDSRTLNIVLPAIQATNNAIDDAMRDGGRLSTSDPRFGYWYPGRVTVGYAVRCADLSGYAAFVLLTSDESRAQLEARGGTADPEWWSQCARPTLQRVPGSDNGYATFLVGS
jgi:hypothetical protein